MAHTTRNLKKHIDELEQKRLSAFFHMQRIATDLNGRLYSYNAQIGIGSLAIVLIASLMDNSDPFLLMWSKLCGLASLTLVFGHSVFVLDVYGSKISKNADRTYRTYNDEYIVLKKFDRGEINENLIRQYYIERAKGLERFPYAIISPGWITWIASSLFITSAIILALA